MQSDVLLECRGLSVEVKGKTLLDCVNFSVRAGEHRVIVGPNGAGKSTLVRALLGLRDVSGGEVFFSGTAQRDIPRRDLAKMIGYVPQLLAAEVPYSVREFVSMGRYAHVASDSETAVEKAMALVNVEEFSERVVSTLSGGERQRVCIAAALAQESSLLILDEPLAHLDPGQRIEVQQVIRGLSDEVTVLVVTHDIRWAQRDFEQLLALKKAKVVFDGASSAFYDEGGVDQLFGEGVYASIAGGRDAR